MNHRPNSRSIEFFWSKLLKVMRGAAVTDSSIDKTSRVHSGTSMVSSTLARHSFIGYDCSVLHADIGPFCSLGSRITIGGATHPVHFVSTSPVFLSHKDSIRAKFARHVFNPAIKTEVGADVWIGDGAYLKAGVQVGHGAVIGMASVVTRDVPPYAIVAGNPARLIRYRFDSPTIDALLASRWWTWSDEELAAHGEFFCDPPRFLQNLRVRTP